MIVEEMSKLGEVGVWLSLTDSLLCQDFLGHCRDLVTSSGQDLFYFVINKQSCYNPSDINSVILLENIPPDIW